MSFWHSFKNVTIKEPSYVPAPKAKESYTKACLNGNFLFLLLIWMSRKEVTTVA